MRLTVVPSCTRYKTHQLVIVSNVQSSPLAPCLANCLANCLLAFLSQTPPPSGHEIMHTRTKVHIFTHTQNMCTHATERERDQSTLLSLVPIILGHLF